MKSFASIVSAFAVSAVVTGVIGGGALLMSAPGRSDAAQAGTRRVIRQVDRSQLTPGEICGTVAPPLAERERIEREIRNFQITGTNASSAKIVNRVVRPPSDISTTTTVVVPVYMHILTQRRDGVLLGNMTDARVGEMMDDLNKAFAGKMVRRSNQIPSEQATGVTRYRFQLMGIDRTQDIPNEREWFEFSILDPELEYEIKSSLRRGGANALNIYTANIYFFTPGDGLGGWAQFPWSYADAPETDGIVMNTAFMPGNAEGNVYKNVTIHEVGHWLGLYHTFQGGCTNDNDYVADTPAQGVVFSPDPVLPGMLPDTCPGPRFPGRDPAASYMNYTRADYFYQFTRNQSQRMTLMGQYFRRM